MTKKSFVSNREARRTAGAIFAMLSNPATLAGIGIFLAATLASSRVFAGVDSVHCKFRGKTGQEIKAEYSKPGLPLTVEMRLGGPVLKGYNGLHNSLTGAMARRDSGVAQIAKAGGVDLSKVDRVGLFVINKDGILVLKFESKGKLLGAVAHLFGTNYPCQ